VVVDLDAEADAVTVAWSRDSFGSSIATSTSALAIRPKRQFRAEVKASGDKRADGHEG